MAAPRSWVSAAVLGGIGRSLLGRQRAGDSPWAAIYAISIAIAVALIGPGSVSLDCRLYGPREVIIPAADRNS